MAKSIMWWYNLLGLLLICCLSSCQASDSAPDNSSVPEQEYSGIGYATGLEQPDANILFAVEVPQSGNYLLEVRYRCTGTTDASALVIINDAPTVKQLQLFAHTNPATWQSAIMKISLLSGINDVIIKNGTASGKLSELDYITITKKP